MSTSDHAESERQVKIICPRCQASGSVPWDRLNRVLQCNQCDTWYRTDSLGKLIEIPEPESRVTLAVRTSFSEWRLHEVTIPRKLTLAARLKNLRRNFRPREWASSLSLGQVLAVATSSLVFLSFVIWSLTCLLSASAETPLPPLPSSLEDRAPLFAHAWLENDIPQMLRLTEAARDRELRRWLARNQPPAVSQPASGTTVEVAGVDRRKGDAKVSIRISFLNASAAKADRMLALTWVQRQGNWYFLPDTPTTKKVVTPAKKK